MSDDCQMCGAPAGDPCRCHDPQVDAPQPRRLPPHRLAGMPDRVPASSEPRPGPEPAVFIHEGEDCEGPLVHELRQGDSLTVRMDDEGDAVFHVRFDEADAHNMKPYVVPSEPRPENPYKAADEGVIHVSHDPDTRAYSVFLAGAKSAGTQEIDSVPDGWMVLVDWNAAGQIVGFEILYPRGFASRQPEIDRLEAEVASEGRAHTDEIHRFNAEAGRLRAERDEARAERDAAIAAGQKLAGYIESHRACECVWQGGSDRPTVQVSTCHRCQLLEAWDAVSGSSEPR